MALFDYLDLRNFHVEKDSLRFHRDSLLINYERNHCYEQCKDLVFPKEFIGDPILKPFISYPDMKTN